MFDPRWLAACLLFALGSSEDPTGTAQVASVSAEVFVSPRIGSFSTGKVRRGEQLVVYRVLDGGWVEIDPPAGSISWMEADDLEKNADDTLRVVVDRAYIRPGRPGALLPGPPRAVLRKGATVRALELPPIVINQGGTPRTWLGVEPPPGEHRFVRSENLRFRGPGSQPFDPSTSAPVRPASRFVGPLPSVDPSIGAVSPTAARVELSGNLAAEFERIELRHRLILKQPPARWQLDAIKADYQTLLERTTDPAAQAALTARIQHVGRQAALAIAARAMEAQLQSSRSRDSELASLERSLEASAAAHHDAYDAEGMLQLSAKYVAGERVSVLIGPEGAPTAYLKVPPTLSIKSLVGKRVGARGRVRYDESLRARLVEVTEVEALGTNR
jgi:hypothetical protein